MAWGSKTSATQLVNVTTEQFFDETPTLNPGEVAHCEVEANPPTTPTDDLIVNVYLTLDASTESWDETPYLTFVIDKDTDPNKRSFVIADVYKFRIGVQRSGSTDTYASADFSYRLDGVSL